MKMAMPHFLARLLFHVGAGVDAFRVWLGYPTANSVDGLKRYKTNGVVAFRVAML